MKVLGEIMDCLKVKVVNSSCPLPRACLYFIEDSKLWGIIDDKYLKVFRGDFTGEWYVAPAVLGALVIILVLFIVCLCRRGRKKKR